MILGIDIGGTKMGSGLVDGRGRVSHYRKQPTSRRSADLRRAIFEIVDSYHNRNLRGIGVAIAGQVDRKQGIFISGPNLPLKRVLLVSLLERRTKLPVAIDNDAHCFTAAEATYGAGKKYETVFGITLGTGIGGGFVKNKTTHHGATDTATEIGHMVIEGHARVRCSCGKFGHLESLAGGRAMEKRFRAITGRPADLRTIERAYRRGNRAAHTVVADATHALATGFANILTTFDPDCIVVGGGLARFRELWQPAIREARARVPFARAKKIPIIPSKLGDHAAVIGATLLLKNRTA